MTEAIRDQNHVTVALGVSSSDATVTLPFKVDPVTGRLKTDASGGGYTNLTQFVSQTAWRLFYSNVDGDVVELALGAADTYLKSNGAAAAPTWAAVAGSGDMILASVQTNSGAKTFLNSTLLLRNPANTFSYTFNAAAIAADRTLNLPLIAATDTLAVLGLAQTFTATQTFGALVATTVNGNTFTTGTYTLTGTAGKTLTFTNTLTFSGTDATVMTFPTTSATIARTDAANTFTGTQTIGALVVTTINGNTFTTGTGTLTIAAAKTLTVSNSITLAGTDATVMTFPTTSKTIAANDGSNWTFASQAIGDLVYASSTTAFTRLAAVALGSVLTSAGTGTAPTWSSAPQITSINLGHATDTTLARVAAGIMSVEGETINGYTTTATAAGTTTLTVASSKTQFFTGSTTQTVALPTTSVVVGQTYRIVNNSTGNVTVQSSGLNTIQILGAGMSALFTAIVATPTTAANWSCSLFSSTGQNIAQTAAANAATVNLAYVTNTITNNSAATITITLPTAGAIDGEMRTVRILDFSAVAQTIAWVNTQNSTATAPVTSNGSTTLPITAGFQYNGASSLWRCIASA